ncbi:MAG: chaperone NapD [Betaproteobacteria bacterium]|nr:chaperone NapD [Betaproteobacteria bacterium]PJC15746.1 MAG: glutamate synthase [Comamonadaceae bacterium CG_4_9_14_0_8_um_filter_57_21]
MNISSAIVYSRPEQEAELRAQLATLVGVEVHAATADGKLVVTIEAENTATAANIYEAIERAEGVLSMALVFQQTESNPEQELAPCK